ncbi:orf9b protein [Xanthoria calcicola]
MKTTGTPATKATGLNMTVWFEMLAFDILGEMAFGESFHCVEAGQPHPWQQMIASHLFLITVVYNLRRYPVARWLGMKLLPPLTKGVQERHTKYSRDKIASRMTSCAPRKDFLSDIIERTKAGELSTEELTAHASTLVIAGGETVAAFLAAVTFYLCKAPLVLRKLQQEIRTNFPTYALIDSSRALQLPYLQAVIREGLRIYPPSPQGLPRVSPSAAVDGCWVPKGTEVYTSTWTVHHSPQYFEDPDEFLPERWLDPRCGDIKEASQPFSVGPRGCIGRNFAYMEMSLILTKLLYTYDMSLVDADLDWEGGSHVHVQWWKPELRVCFGEHKDL